MQTTVAIVGAGISGLSLARVLTDAGVPVRVFERASRNSRQGYGITMRGWATTALTDQLGIENDRLVAATATDGPAGGRGYIDPTVVDAFSGTPLMRADKAPTGSPETSFYRANRNRLRDFLLDGVDVQFDAPVTGVTVGNGRSTLTFDSRPPESVGLVIAADGVHSGIRTAQLPEVSAAVSHAGVCTGLRRLTRAEFNTELAPHLRGSNVHSAFGDNALLALTVVDLTADTADVFWSYIRPAHGPQDRLAAANRDIAGTARLAELMAVELADMPPLATPFAEFLTADRIRDDQMFNWLMRSVRVPRTDLDRLGGSGVGFIGDAAHAMPIFAGEGGNHAMLDGVELGRCLAADPADPAAALTRFYDGAYDRWQHAITGSEQRLPGLTRPIQQWRALAAQAR
jgi:monooxygenase